MFRKRAIILEGYDYFTPVLASVAKGEQTWLKSVYSVDITE